MTYEIGQKVETPLGVGKITFISKFTHDLTPAYHVRLKGHELCFSENELKPYKTPHDKLIELGYELLPHDKLIELGYELIQGANLKIYRHDKLMDFRVYDDNTISCNEIDLELAKIIKEYLEWLEEEK